MMSSQFVGMEFQLPNVIVALRIAFEYTQLKNKWLKVSKCLEQRGHEVIRPV